MNIRCENQIRKIDNLGRVTIPKGLRDRVGLSVNDEVMFYMIETDRNYYIGLRPIGVADPKYGEAAAVLKELGLPVPKELQDRV